MAVVDGLNPSESLIISPLVRFSFMLDRTLLANTFPSSTPHWSNELRPQMKPCVATRCWGRYGGAAGSEGAAAGREGAAVSRHGMHGMHDGACLFCSGIAPPWAHA